MHICLSVSWTTKNWVTFTIQWWVPDPQFENCIALNFLLLHFLLFFWQCIIPSHKGHRQRLHRESVSSVFLCHLLSKYQLCHILSAKIPYAQSSGWCIRCHTIASAYGISGKQTVQAVSDYHSRASCGNENLHPCSKCQKCIHNSKMKDLQANIM